MAYAVWCDDAGRLIDDGTVFRLAEQEYRLCTGERQLDWLLDSSVGFDVAVTEVTAEIAALALQGPCSCWVLKTLGLEGVETLAPFEHRSFNLPVSVAAAGAAVMVSRTGFTGDLGYELWVDPVDAERLWDALMEAGRVRTIRPVGSRALNIARLEAGFLLPNMDFVSSAHTLRNGTARSPLELGLGWCVDFGKGHFTGRRALLEEKAERRGGGSSGWMSRAPSPPTTRSCTPTGAAAGRSAASRRPRGHPPASATSRSPWWPRRTSRSGSRCGPRST